ncbi:MAG: hypothetical protein ACPGVI_00115 [Crocinitomicaceae bacterium]
MKLILYAFVGLIAIITFSSCEGNTRRTWEITNSSSFKVELTVDSLSQELLVNTIAPGATETILITDTRGGNSNHGPITEWLEFTIQSGTSMLTKDPLNDSNWSVYSDQLSKVPSEYQHDFVFQFDDSDF